MIISGFFIIIDNMNRFFNFVFLVFDELFDDLIKLFLFIQFLAIINDVDYKLEII